MSELTCTACGRPVRTDARFCTACGTPVAHVTVVEAQPPTRRSSATGRRRSTAPPDAATPRATSVGRPAPAAPAVPAALRVPADPFGAAPAAGRAAAPVVGTAARPGLVPGGPASGGAAGLGPAFDGVSVVGVGARLGAYALDALVVSLVAAGVLLTTGQPVLGALVGVELVVGLVVWEARTGRTFGNLALGLRAARVETPFAPGLARAARRALVLLAGHLVAGVGQWVVLGSVAGDRGPLRQGWHDKAGRAVVVDVRRPRTSVLVPAPSSPDASAATYGGLARAGVPGASPLADRAVAPAVPVAASAAVPGVPGLARTPGLPGASLPPGLPPVPAGVPGVAPTGSHMPSAAPAVPPAPAPGAVPRPRSYVLTLDTGEALSVSGPGLLGRAPRPRDGERCDHVVTIDDPQRSLSRTHARFGIDARGLWVADAGSGNGTVVVLPSGQSVVVAPERPTPVPPGSTIRLGDRTVLVDQLRG